MKSKWTVFIWIAVLCLGLVGCQAEKPEEPAGCGHEKYLSLIDSLEAEDYSAARRIIDAMEGSAPAATEAADAETMAATQPVTKVPDSNALVVELDIRNFTDYFEVREDLIFENPVQCYQSIQLREEYIDRLVDIQNINVEVSYFDACAYGELDHEDQLFFPEYYNMVTGELALREIFIGSNGEGFLSLGSYAKGCFRDYMMDIAITEVTGNLILEAE